MQRRHPIFDLPNQAFSLVELSIVLVILGLLVGGILAGQSLIRASELRAVGNEYQRYVTAGQAFRDKYFAIPGDMTNATSFWGKDATYCNGQSGTANATTGTCNGDGNGRILPGSPLATSEIFQLWRQLALAGLIEGNYTGITGASYTWNADIGINVPASKLSGAGWSGGYDATYNAGNANTFTADYGNFLVFGTEGGDVNLTIYPALTPAEAWNIDTKLDDGVPGTGKVIPYGRTWCSDSTSSTDYTGSYKLGIPYLRCPIFFARSFY